MRHLRHTVLMTVAVALCTAPVAAADNRDETSHGAVVAPASGGGLTGGEMLGEDWARGLARSSPDPFDGSLLTPLVIRDNPATAGPDANYLQYTGDEHVVLGGTAGDDIIISSLGDDTV